MFSNIRKIFPEKSDAAYFISTTTQCRKRLFSTQQYLMLKNRKIVVVLPAYNAAKTLKKTFDEIPHEIVDEIILVDDCSSDETIFVAQSLNIQHILKHDKNKGYGGNQKTCFKKALALDADIIVLLHPDYQYPPKLMVAMVSLIADEMYPVVFASRILGNGALKGGMPLYKYFFNRVLTFVQNIFLNEKLSEYHTGYRAYSSQVLAQINFEKNSDDYIFDNEIISQIVMKNFEIAEITCPTKYFAEASTINFSRSVNYGFGILRVSVIHFLQRKKIIRSRFY